MIYLAVMWPTHTADGGGKTGGRVQEEFYESRIPDYGHNPNKCSSSTVRAMQVQYKETNIVLPWSGLHDCSPNCRIRHKPHWHTGKLVRIALCIKMPMAPLEGWPVPLAANKGRFLLHPHLISSLYPVSFARPFVVSHVLYIFFQRDQHLDCSLWTFCLGFHAGLDRDMVRLSQRICRRSQHVSGWGQGYNNLLSAHGHLSPGSPDHPAGLRHSLFKESYCYQIQGGCFSLCSTIFTTSPALLLLDNWIRMRHLHIRHLCIYFSHS